MQFSTGAVPLSDTRTTLLHSHISQSRPSPLIFLPRPFHSIPYSSSRNKFKLLCRRGSPDSVADTISNFRSRIRSNSRVTKNAADNDLKSEGSERSGRFKEKNKRGRRAWWSDNEYLDYDEEEGPAGILEEFIDSAWIFRVFLSYGWMLPLITLSLLVVSGPKAFLMALALPFGISVLTLIINKLWPSSNVGARGKQRRSRFSTSRYYSKEAEDDAEDDVLIEEEEIRSSTMRKKKNRRKDGGYQSWVAAAASQRRRNNKSVSVNKNGTNGGGRGSRLSSFGGWDDLVMGVGEGRNSSSSSKK